MDQIRVKQATRRRPLLLLWVATSSIDIRNVLSLFRPLLPLARALPHMLLRPSAHQLLRYICVWEGSIIGKELLLRCGQPRRSTPFLPPLSLYLAVQRGPTFHLYRMGCM